ncbi:MAG: FitA-like ribbon-helix-helix domain-containing protein [Hyphomicrobiales bacterium]
MATLTIRDLPDMVRNALRVAAARNGRSMEAEVRDLLVKRYGSLPEARDEQSLERLREAQAIIEPFLPKGRNLTDEFLSERKNIWGEE